jgi:hypothetical protein
MFENFKESIKQGNSLNWLILSISFMMLIINPEKQNEFSLLGLKISLERTIVVIPLFILLLTVFRGILINNSILVLQNESKTKIKSYKEFIYSYPLFEFIRWKSENTFDLLFLTVFQVVISALPGMAISSYPYILMAYGYGIEKNLTKILFVSGLVVVYLGERNYSLLRRKIYETLLGTINTPD